MRLLTLIILIWSVMILTGTADQLTLSYQRIDDTYIYSGGAGNNFGADFVTKCTGTRATLLRLDATFKDSIGTGMVIDALEWNVRISGNGVSDTMPAFDVYKANCWVEGTGTSVTPTTTGATWNDFDAPNSQWGTAGCANASDAGSANCTDAGGFDRSATAYDTLFTGASGTGYVQVNSRPSYVQAMYDAGLPVSILLGIYAGNNTDFHSTEASSPSTNAEYVVITYHLASNNPPRQRQRRSLSWMWPTVNEAFACEVYSR